MNILHEIYEKMNGDNPRAVYELFPFELTCMIVGFAMIVGSLALSIGAIVIGILWGMWEIIAHIAGLV